MENLTLYERIGGDNALKQLTDKFYDLVFEHELISRLFKSDKDLIKEKQRLFLTQFLGGPQLYSDVYGHPMMRARHMPHTITEDDAVAWLQCMAAAVGELPISKELKDELFDRFPRTAFFMVNS
nr:globin [uncultured Dyadobacter sp.]